MRPCAFLLLALASGLVSGAVRPRYGGTIQIEMRAAVQSLDPSEWPSDSDGAFAKEQIVNLLFDRLVTLDDRAQPQPSLAASWQHDADFRTWEFRARSGVKFSDGSPLAARDIGAAFRSQVVRRIVSNDLVMVEFEHSMPNLLLELARGRNAVFRRSSNGDLAGTGPFRATAWQPGRHLTLEANTDYWEGRPFLDSIAIDLDRPWRQQWIDLELGKADVIEIAPNGVPARDASRRPVVTWSSYPTELLALVMDGIADARMREALALSIDRTAIYNVLLQRRGETAGSLLPQWLSGYAFLFAPGADAARARQLAAAASKNRLLVGYDASDPLLRTIAERIAINAREAGLNVQTAAAGKTEARLVTLRIRSTAPAAALAEIAAGLGYGDFPEVSGAQALYTMERSLLDGFRIVPLFHLPQLQALSARIRDWMPAPWGAWRLADIWVSPP